MNNYSIRVEEERDYSTVESLVRESFWNVYRPGCTEHYVLHHLRSNPDFIPELAFVMEADGKNHRTKRICKSSDHKGVYATGGRC